MNQQGSSSQLVLHSWCGWTHFAFGDNDEAQPSSHLHCRTTEALLCSALLCLYVVWPSLCWCLKHGCPLPYTAMPSIQTVAPCHAPMDMKHFLGRLFITVVAWGFSQQQLLDVFVVCNEGTAGGQPRTSLWLEFSPAREMHLLNQRKWFLVTGSLIQKLTWAFS